MVGRDVFLKKPMHQYHLSQWGECVYGAQSWNESRVLSESMFFPIEKWTSNLKMADWEVFLMKQKHEYIYPNGENEFVVANH